MLEGSPPPLGVAGSAAIFGGAAAVLFLGSRLLIPFLSQATGTETILWWFIVGGATVFAPMLALAAVLLGREGAKFGGSLWTERLRFSRPSPGDVVWSLAALAAIGVMSFVIMKAVEAVLGSFSHSPSFMAFDPLSPGRYWLLAAWLPFWIFNIMGEEILWRGVLLPRQETAFGRWAWVVHGLGWGLFHVAFGWQLLLMLLPIFFIQSYVVQRRANSWVGVMIHGGLNGPAFIVISFGLIG